jgi:hypothetical protein
MTSPRHYHATEPIATSLDWEFVYALANKFSMPTLINMFEYASNNSETTIEDLRSRSLILSRTSL